MLCGVFSCSAPKEDQDKTDLYDEKELITIDKDAIGLLMDEVIAIHDEVMPEMGDIRKTRKALLEKLETSTDEELNKVLQEQANKLDESHEAMFVWMRQFNPEPDSAMTDAMFHEYLVDQKQKMIVVRDLMVNSLKEGKALLGGE